MPREAGITRWMARWNPNVLHIVERTPLGKTMRSKYVFFNSEYVV
jgi:hypothetical protein